MKLTLKHTAQVIAIILGIGIGGGAVQAVAAPFFQDHDQDYSKNKNYQRGMQDGKNDRAKNMDHSKKRHYKKDEDQKAYEAGYQKSRN